MLSAIRWVGALGLVAAGCAEDGGGDGLIAGVGSDGGAPSEERIGAPLIGRAIGERIRERMLDEPATECTVHETSDTTERTTIWRHSAEGLPVESVRVSTEGHENVEQWLRRRNAEGEVEKVYVVRRWTREDGSLGRSLQVEETWEDGRLLDQWYGEHRYVGTTWTWNEAGELVASSHQGVDGTETYRYAHDGLPIEQDGLYDYRASWYWSDEGVLSGRAWSTCCGNRLTFTIEDGLPTVGAGSTGYCYGGWRSWTETWTWDEHGRPIAYDSGGVRGNEWVWEDDRITTELAWRLEDDGTLSEDVVREYEWDAQGRMAAEREADSTRTWTWNADGTLREATTDDRYGSRSVLLEGTCPEGVWRWWAPEDPTPSPAPDRVVVRGFGM